jgi:hypothetical protein
MAQGVSGLTKIAIDTGTIAEGASIAAYVTDAAGALITSTLVGGDQSLDVNITQSVLPTGAATETTLASILSELQGYTYAEDSAHSSGDIGIMGLAVRNDAGTSLVSADGDYSPLSVDATGALRIVGSIVVNEAGDYAEDSAHSSGDFGYFNLAVRNDAQSTTLTSATGDYSGFAVDDKGAMFVKDIANKSNLQQVVTVGTSAVALPASPLANRSSMFVQMLSGGDLYLGSATVTNSGSTRGFMIGKGGYVTIDAGPANAVYGIANAAGKDVLVWEFA